MKIGEIKVISSKENSSMASIWTTFLCLERLSEDEYQVCIRAYEILCTADDIREELNLIEDMYFDIYEHLPDIYNGKKVEGIDDGEYIFGGDLEEMNNEVDDEVCIFNKDNPEPIKDYLRRNGWPLENYFAIKAMY